MITAYNLRINPGVSAASRFGRATTGVYPGVLDLLVLSAAGASAAVMRGLLDLHLGLPGHSILLVVLPYTLGLAAVQRNGSGIAMSAAASITFFSMRGLGLGGQIGPGALTSLMALGPLLDFFVSRVKKSCLAIYSAAITAAVVTNAVAFTTRAITKLSGARPGHHLWQSWLPRALASYTVCAIVAGLVSAAIAFRYHQRQENNKRVGS